MARKVEIQIVDGERYPDFLIVDAGSYKRYYGPKYSVSESTLRRWKRVIDAYQSVQDEMEKIVDKSNGQS